jgi:predicted membrane-bound spermidine synthase
MFKKVLIAEDHEVANLSVHRTVQEYGVAETKYVYYCDDALTWIRNAIREGEPYDLLITDLVFEDDIVPQKNYTWKRFNQSSKRITARAQSYCIFIHRKNQFN